VKEAIYRKVSRRRARSQRGSELLEFAILAGLLAPMLLWMFVAGMNLIRMIQCTAVTRDIGNLYIHGLDFSTWAAQDVAATLASSYNLQIGSSFSGNEASNAGNGGYVYVILSELTYVGANSCAALPTGTTCTNEDKYVYLQYLNFGNSGVQINGNTVSSSIGSAPTASMTSYGTIPNYLTDSGAVAANAGNYITLSDGQVAYAIEAWYASPDLGFSAYPGGGIYSKFFF
jgi:hypothetical protein